MYNDYISQIKSDITVLHEMSRVIEYLDRKQSLLYSMRNEIQSLLADESYDSARSVREIKSDDAVRILKQYALRAIRDTTEFNIGEYRQRLVQAIEDPKTIKIYYDSSTNDVDVRIDLRYTAGDLDDYARGIQRTRRQLRVGPYRKRPVPPELASYMWMEKYYKPAREGADIPQPKRKERTSNRKPRKDRKEAREYDVAKYIGAYRNTMKLRLQNFGSLAPFWQIINDGSPFVLDSDYGGEGYPYVTPTRFVEKAARAIRALIGRSFKNQNSNIKELRERLTSINLAIKYIDWLLPILAQRVTEIGEPKTKKEFTLVEVRKALGTRFGNTDSRKVLDAVNGLVEGTIDPGRKISLTKKGTGVQVRMRVKRLYNLVQAYREAQ